MRNLPNTKINLYKIITKEDELGGFIQSKIDLGEFFCDIIAQGAKCLSLALRKHPEIKNDVYTVYENQKYKLQKMVDLKNGFLKLTFEIYGK